jgi:hypothetical protein
MPEKESKQDSLVENPFSHFIRNGVQQSDRQKQSDHQGG